jgi:hypothetical protein
MKHVVLALLVGATVAHAADQTILGKQLLVKDPGTATKRKVVGTAKENASPNTLVGDPTIDGATLTVRVDGATSSNQVFVLPQGTTSKGKPFWTGSATAGFKYKDPKGDNGPVKLAQIKKSRRGVFTIKFKALGKLGAVSVVPPDPGESGCVLLELNGGDSYSVEFGPGDGKITNKDGRLFKVTKPTVEGTCVTTPTTTSTSSSTTSTTPSTSSTTTTSTTTSTTSTSGTSSTTSTSIATNLDGPAFPPVGGSADFAFVGNSQDPGGADLSLFNFAPASWTQLYWGPDSSSLPAAGLDGMAHVLSTFAGISGGGTIATWEGVTDWTDPSDSTTYTDVPLQLTITVTAGGVMWVSSASIPGLDPGPGTGIGAVVDVAPGGTAQDLTVKFEFKADIPTDASGFVALSTIPQQGGGLTVASFSGGFYSEP